ncbi:MAG: 2-amino-4-hydroxy-6-hydroxymethyldihydropteridine diphosphokinase [Pseudomonadota bacterium]
MYIGIGSNLGERQDNCVRAVNMIKEIPGCNLTACSDWYLTSPVGVEDQDWYINGVACMTTSMPARKLLDHLLAVEREMGRVRRELWDSRIIDLDILLFGAEIIDEENLRVPHPFMHLRRFVLVPMAQMEPDLIHPSLGMSMAELLQKLPEDDQVVMPIKE